ncbi:hypothetical protein HY004_01400 [Candidatus Saccharibacteria bacterium]|nr:hypothetical protein [Candidatus Saccharibacteria bacterium]
MEQLSPTPPQLKQVTLQSLFEELGEYDAMRSCTPTSFYMLLQAIDGLPDSQSAADFVRGLNTDEAHTTDHNWSRPALSAAIREAYDVAVVSWQLNGGTNIEAMQKAGYLETDQEVEVFNDAVSGRSVEDVVRAGYPVMVTMQPNFGDTGSQSVHSVIIEAWHDAAVTVVDSDARNTSTQFSPDEIRQSISPQGAGTIVLPKHPQQN